MPKLKIIEKGFENYNGKLGDVDFVDGVSEYHVSHADARRLSSIMAMIDADSGANPSITQDMVNERSLTVSEMELARSNSMRADGKPNEPEPPKPTRVKDNLDYSYTQTQLEKLADAEGIKGLRAFAEKYDVRGASIQTIIESLIAVRDEHDARKVEEGARKGEVVELSKHEPRLHQPPKVEVAPIKVEVAPQTNKPAQ